MTGHLRNLRILLLPFAAIFEVGLVFALIALTALWKPAAAALADWAIRVLPDPLWYLPWMKKDSHEN